MGNRHPGEHSGDTRRRRRGRALAAAVAVLGLLGVVRAGADGAGTHPRPTSAAPARSEGPAPVTRSQGTVPPNNPPANIPPNPNFLDDCSGTTFDNSQGCARATVQAIDNGRAQEGLAGMSLPSDWYSLTAQQQLYVATNLERTIRGLPALSGMATALDQSADQGAAQSEDPTPPSGFPWTSWGSNWAGAVGNPLEAIYYWMYDDGEGSGNIDCTQSNTSGCWGHRDNVLMSLSCQPCLMGTGYVSNGYEGYPSWAELLVDTSGSPQLDYSWSQVTPYLSDAGAGPLDPDLFEFVSDHANNRVWNAYDQTQAANGPGIYALPSAIAIGSVIHVFTWAADGDLVEFVSDHQNGRVWNAYDHSLDAGGGGPISGSPYALLDGNGLVHVFVPGANGHLMEYLPDHANGHVWNAYDHTDDAGGGTPINGSPTAIMDAAGLVHVFVESSTNHLMEYLPDHVGGHVWNAYDHTLDAGGATVTAGTPSAIVDANHLVHVYVQSYNGHLYEYLPDHVGGHVWNAYDHTLDAGGGTPVANAPGAVFDPGSGLVHVFVESASGHLMEYLPDHVGGHVWNAYDHSLDAGGATTVNGVPDAVYDTGSQMVHVFVRSGANDLVEFLPDHANGHVWNAYDHTDDAAGPTIGTDPGVLDVGGVIQVYVGGE